MERLRAFIITISRFCISVFFLVASVKNVLYWHESEGRLMSALLDWQTYIDFSNEMSAIISFFISFAPLIHGLITTMMLVGGLLVLIGVKEKLGIVLLVLFLIPNAILYHPFWWVDGVMREVETMLFFKDVALVGCLMNLLLPRESSSAYIDSDRMSDSFI
jgi:uncharacterized membrane protein YphA (DoxX/SURF4 family)